MTKKSVTSNQHLSIVSDDSQVTSPASSPSSYSLIHGDCLEVMRTMADESIDSIVCDPPYGIGFMSAAWDDAVPGVEWASECLRVLKPGGHLLAFGGTRTYHRLACAIEDAGFEIRDTIAWLRGQAFPKNVNVSKAIDKHFGATRQVVGVEKVGGIFGRAPIVVDAATTEPATDEARVWAGWGTAMKPAQEPIVVARKPLTGTVVSNVLRHGTGPINIDGCRVPVAGDSGKARWPANVILDDAAASELDREAPSTGGLAPISKGHDGSSRGIYGDYAQRGDDGATFYADGQGGASRFFQVVPQEELPIDDPARYGFRYVAKPSPKERNAGLESFGDPDEKRKNVHLTVKPIELMRYLCRLVTPRGGTVLDPFMGSGTTGCAVGVENLDPDRAPGWSFVGIERDGGYLDIAVGRVAQWALQEPVVTKTRARQKAA